MQSAIEVMRADDHKVSNRRPWKRLHPLPEVTAQIVDVPAVVEPKEKAKPKEKEHHLQYFDYYCALGQNRTLTQVAEHFKRPPQEMSRWSRTFGWLERVKEFEKKTEREKSRDVRSFLRGRLLKVIGLKLREFLEPDPDNPGEERLVRDDKKESKATYFAIKQLGDAINVQDNQDKNETERQKTEKEIDKGSSVSPGGKGVMVNLFFTGLNEAV